MSRDKVYPVSAVNLYVKRMLQMDAVLADIRVSGEISNFKHHSSGHLYFTLKDAGGSIQAVMFASDARHLRFYPKNGDEVIASGSVSLYEKTGTYQLYVRGMEKNGSGDLYLAFEELKHRLEKEGLFDPARKKPIPAFPRAVGIITSATGAAVRDVIQIAARRYPGVRLILYPALVQGSTAADTLVQGLRVLGRHPLVDTIILCRGGGSIEDLWPFNEEKTARAIAACPKPVISAVGHETDFTISDFAADLRAPTPSAAAELAVPDVRIVLDQLSALRSKERLLLLRKHRQLGDQLKLSAGKLTYFSPVRMLEERQMEADAAVERQYQLINNRIEQYRHRLEKLDQILELDSPIHQLERGYAFVTDRNGQIISSVEKLQARDLLQITMKDGQAAVTVDAVTKEEQP